MLDFQELRVFVAICETSGFRNAAKKVHITQSAVSQSLKNLERKIGEELILRGPPAQPTLIGYQLLRHARIILDREEDFKKDVERMKQGFLQQLNLAVDFLVNKYFCHQILAELSLAFPSAQYKVKRLPARKIIEAVREGEFELGFGPFQKNMAGFKKYSLFSETSYLVTSTKNKDFCLYKVDPMRFLRESVLLASFIDDLEDRPSRKKIRHYFQDTWEIDTLALQVSLMDQGVGVTFVPETTLKSLAKPLQKSIKVLDKVPFYQISKPYGIYHKKEGELSTIAKEFVKLGREVVY